MPKDEDSGSKGEGKGKRGRRGGVGRGGGAGAQPPMACAMKFLTPEALAAAIIGKGGAIIEEMRSSTSTKLKFTEHQDLFPGTDARVFTAQADTEDNLQALVKQVVERLSSLAEDGNARDAVGVEGELKLGALLPRAAGGGFIGKGGANIKQLREDSGAKISIAEPTGSRPGDEQCLTVVGSASAIETVLLEVNKHIQALSGEAWFAAWVTCSSTSMAGALSAGGLAGGYGAGTYTSHSPGVQTMLQVAQGLPPYVTEDSRGFAMSCVVPSHLVGGLIGRGGSGTKEVQKLTGTKISIRDIPEDPDNRSLNIEGPLANTCAAYMLMMRRYLDVEAEASWEW